MNGTMQATKSRNGTSSPNQNKNPKNRGSKTTDRASPRSPLPEKKLTSKVSEMESQLAQFQEELKKAKDQLSSLESQKKRAQQEAEESKKQISFLSAKLENSQQQLIELSDSEDARLQELRKLSQERDRSWQSELEALQKQHASDSTALSSAMNEIQRLKKQLETTSESARVEIQSLRIELSETLNLVEKIKHQLADAFEVIRSDRLKSKEDYDSLASELEQSKAQVNTLENSTDELKMEIDSLKPEIEKLKSALDASEARYQNEYIQSTLQIRSAYEAVERVKLETGLKEAALVEELKKAKEEIEELKSDLASKQNIVQKISHENEELKNNHKDLTEMKSTLLDKETQFQTLAEENEMLRTEIAKEGEKEADEANERGQRSRKFGELLDTTQMEKEELEDELKKLKVQADQWRKAAEAAAAILSPGHEGTVSVDTIGMKMDLPFSDKMDDDSPKKKNANMLKKIGGLWKKGQK